MVELGPDLPANQVVLAITDRDVAELLRIKNTTGMSYIAQTASSWTDIMKSPSPMIHTTGVSGFASFAPIAAGSANPIDENEPEVMWVRGSYTGKACLVVLCG